MKIKKTIKSYRYRRNGKPVIVKKHMRTYSRNRNSMFVTTIDPDLEGGKRDAAIGMSRARAAREAREKYLEDLKTLERNIEMPLKKEFEANVTAEKIRRDYTKKWEDFNAQKEAREKRETERMQKEEQLPFETPIAEDFVKDLENPDRTKGVRVIAETILEKEKKLNLKPEEAYNPYIHKGKVPKTKEEVSDEISATVEDIKKKGKRAFGR